MFGFFLFVPVCCDGMVSTDDPDTVLPACSNSDGAPYSERDKAYFVKMCKSAKVDSSIFFMNTATKARQATTAEPGICCCMSRVPVCQCTKRC